MSKPSATETTAAPVTHVATPSIWSMLAETVVLTAKVIGSTAVLGTAATKCAIVEANIGMLTVLDYGTAGKDVCDARTAAREARVQELKAAQAALAAELAELEC
jgi:hypothetical protein